MIGYWSRFREVLIPLRSSSFFIACRRHSESLCIQGEGIFDGDQVVVRPQPMAENGELMAVMIEGEATVKRFFRDSADIVRLEPANPAYKPIVISLKDSRTLIIGKVVGLLRSYR